ncbi:MAG: hypothetical protein U5L96_17090 [Owenweeksia sp.]|nr:hypothetical protein [Owenweeksia sp.]
MNKMDSYTRMLEDALARQDFDHQPTQLYEPIRYILNLGGKRLRPALCLAGCELTGAPPQDALLPALG